MNMRAGPAAAAAFVILVTAGAQAATIAKLSVEELTAAARTIVHARAISSTAFWEGGEIWTSTEFQALETWKGDARDRMTVRLVGGRVGAVRSIVEGVPRFAAGEEVVLFLEQKENGQFSVIAWSEGTFRVHRDALSGAATVTQDSSAPLYDIRARTFLRTGVHNLALEAFRERVAEAVASQPRRTR